MDGQKDGRTDRRTDGHGQTYIPPPLAGGNNKQQVSITALVYKLGAKYEVRFQNGITIY